MPEAGTDIPVKKRQTGEPAESGAWTPLSTLRNEIDGLFESFDPFGWRSRGQPSRMPFQGRLPVMPSMDVTEADEEYEITLDLPGMQQDDIDVTLSKGVLTVSGQMAREREVERKSYHLSERQHGSFRRAIRLPDDAADEDISAKFANGVLSVKVPKSPESRDVTKKIKVKAG